MELLEYLVQLRGAQVTSAELKGVRDQFVKVGVAARDAAAASGEGAAGSAAAASGHGRASASAAGFGAAAKKIAAAGAIGLVALGLSAVKMSNTFQTEMLKIRTEAGASGREFRMMRHDVLQLALSGQSFGQGPTSLAQGLYHLESMGIRGRKAILGLKLASAEAAISGASLEDTTTSLGGALFIAAKGTHGLTGVMGALNAIAGAGNMRFQDLNEALGTGVLGSAKIAGISLQEMGAALAVLTDSGYKASSAGAQLGTALHFLYSPTRKAENALGSIGLTGAKLAADLRKPQGILVALRDLRAHMEHLHMSPIAQEQLLNSILPGGRGRVLLNLYQLQNRLDPKYRQILGTQNDFGAHMLQQASNPATKLRVQWAKLEALLIIFGDSIKKYVMPIVVVFLGALAKMLIDVMNAVKWFARMGPAARALATFVSILAAAFVLYRTALIAGTIAQAVFNLVMDANPISLVIIAIAALAAGIMYAYHKVGWFRHLVDAVWKWLKGAVIAVIGFVSKHWKLIGSILGGPFVALGILVATHFGTILRFLERMPGKVAKIATSIWDAIKTGLVAAINFVIGALNHVIDAYNSVVGSIPFFGGDLKISHIAMITAGGGKSKTSGSVQRTNAAKARAHTTTRAFTNPLAPVARTGQGPLIVHGDIILRARENELGKVTRRQIHKAQMG